MGLHHTMVMMTCVASQNDMRNCLKVPFPTDEPWARHKMFLVWADCVLSGISGKQFLSMKLIATEIEVCSMYKV